MTSPLHQTLTTAEAAYTLALSSGTPEDQRRALDALREAQQAIRTDWKLTSAFNGRYE